jgi:DNA-binding IclR family transcriptional regulator
LIFIVSDNRIDFYYINLLEFISIYMSTRNSNPSTSKPEKPEGVAAVNRALTVLRAFESSAEGLTLAMLATQTGLYESTILRLLDSLQHAGFVKKLPDGRYLVGPSVLLLSEMYRKSFRLSDYVLPRLRQLANESGECAGLYVREGDKRVCLHHVQPQRAVRWHVLEGEQFPLDRGAAGRVILAIDEGTPGKPYEQIRKQGYAITQKERDPESAALACPVFAHGSKLLGAMSLVIPLYRFNDALVSQLLPQIQKCAAALTEDLGGVSPYSNR